MFLMVLKFVAALLHCLDFFFSAMEKQMEYRLSKSIARFALPSNEPLLTNQVNLHQHY